MIWSRIREWFQGKKTIIGGSLVIAAGVAAVALGKLAPVEGMALVGMGVSICGWSAKANRYQTQILGALEAVAAAGLSVRAGKGSREAIFDLKPLGIDAIKLVAAKGAIPE
jgi:hypothetical protein